MCFDHKATTHLLKTFLLFSFISQAVTTLRILVAMLPEQKWIMDGEKIDHVMRPTKVNRAIPLN